MSDLPAPETRIRQAEDAWLSEATSRLGRVPGRRSERRPAGPDGRRTAPPAEGRTDERSDDQPGSPPDASTRPAPEDRHV